MNNKILDLQFGDTKVPFVQIGISGTLFVGPVGDVAYILDGSDRQRRIKYDNAPHVNKPVFYRLNRELIEKAVPVARAIFEQYQRESGQEGTEKKKS